MARIFQEAQQLDQHFSFVLKEKILKISKKIHYTSFKTFQIFFTKMKN